MIPNNSGQEREEKGFLYVVATPIGNLDDITFRAVETLRKADIIACEDSRVASKLLTRYEIKKKLIVYHQHSEAKAVSRLIENMLTGSHVALVTDAGTPGISDPGNMLVRNAVLAGIRIVPLPGPSALTALLSVCGEDVQQFVFLGFPPHKKGRKTFFESIAKQHLPVVYYESSHRFLKSLGSLQGTVPERKLVVGRELTKMFEEVVRGTPSEVRAHYESQPGKVKGEFVILVIS